jgi:uncharacterized protein (DUF1778 family)
VGRPPKAEREKRSYLLGCRVNRTQHRLVVAAAREAGQSVSDFVLSIVLSKIATKGGKALDS